jgi:predicted O-methyltransferase YrrM
MYSSVLEIGTFIGFSTMAWAEAVGADGHVTALEFEPAYAKLAEEAWAADNIKNCEIIIGDAAESMKKLATTITEPYDLIFIDADKSSYPNYLDLILKNSQPGQTGTRILKKGGIILADNILRRGLIADSSDANPWSARLDRNGGLWKAGMSSPRPILKTQSGYSLLTPF